MRSGSPARLAWGLWLLLIALLAITVTLGIQTGSIAEDPLFLSSAILTITGYGTVGALLAARSEGARLGWVMTSLAFTYVFAGFSTEYADLSFTAGLPFSDLAAWVSTWAFVFVVAPLILTPLLFPDGRVPGRRWRWVPATVLAATALSAVATALRPGRLDVDRVVRNPYAIEPLGPALTAVQNLSGIVLIACAILAGVSVVLRFRRSVGEQRQQVRWLAVTAGTALVVFVAALIVGALTGDEDGLGINILFFTFLFSIGIGVPVSIGVAVLRYRLYDLDLVVKKTVLYALVAALLVLVFLAVAVVVGGIAGRTQTGAIVAAAVIGVAFWPAVRVARRVADRIVYGRRATPYEILSEFSHRVAGSYAAEDVLPRMAQILAGAVGAIRAVVWLRVGTELRPAGIAPAAEPPPDAVRMSGDRMPSLPADAIVEVRDRDEILGALTVSMPANDPMNPSRERLVRDLASQAGLVLRNVRLIEELRASRQRVVAAQDAERRRLERNIHDGAQQQLVALTVKLRLLEQLAGRDPASAAKMAAQLQSETTRTLEDLRDLARGIYPPLLADRGLPAALEAHARKTSLPVTLHAGAIGRLPQDVEAAVYFSCLEALNNVAKYAGASRVTISLDRRDGVLSFAVADDGVGFDPDATSQGTGLQGIADRLDALGGTFRVTSRVGAGTTVTGTVPVRERVVDATAAEEDHAAPRAAAQASSSRSGPKTDFGM